MYFKVNRDPSNQTFINKTYKKVQVNNYEKNYFNVQSVMVGSAKEVKC